MASNLIESYGSDVVFLNLTPEEIFLIKNKDTFLDTAKDKLQHLTYSPFKNSEELIMFISRLLGADINLVSDYTPEFINNALREFHEIKCVNSHFDPNKPNTWCELVDESLIGLNDMLPVHIEEVSLSESDSVTDDKIKENIYTDLDDNSVRLLYGLMTNSYSMPYNKAMRDTIYNEVKNKKNDSAVGRVVLHSLKEEAVGLSDLMEHHGMDVAKEVQTRKTYVFDFEGDMFACARIGDNQYLIEKLK